MSAQTLDAVGSSPTVVCVIPARLAATRLPDKPLLYICGKTMIQRVWERARLAPSLHRVIVATPDASILATVEQFGGEAMMTSDSCRSGTDRVAEVARAVPGEIFVNVQGDEPLIEPEAIERAIAPLLAYSELNMSSLMCRCPDEDLDNPACVKVVTDLQGRALYFSRARIPFDRSASLIPHPSSLIPRPVMQHIGLYAYRREHVIRLAGLAPTPLELMESLEQLRALENGYSIQLSEVPRAPLSIDTPDDLRRVRAILEPEIEA